MHARLPTDLHAACSVMASGKGRDNACKTDGPPSPLPSAASPTPELRGPRPIGRRTASQGAVSFPLHISYLCERVPPSCAACHHIPCAQGPCGRCPPGSGVMPDGVFLYLNPYCLTVTLPQWCRPCLRLMCTAPHLLLTNSVVEVMLLVDVWLWRDACCPYAVSSPALHPGPDGSSFSHPSMPPSEGRV